MTVECTCFTCIPNNLEQELSVIERDAYAALRRASKTPPGDVSEITRFEALCALIARRAAQAEEAGAASVVIEGKEVFDCPPAGVLRREAEIRGGLSTLPAQVQAWLFAGSLVVVRRLPHFRGPTQRPPKFGQGPLAAANRWHARTRQRREVDTERFSSQIENALATGAKSGWINPSGISNRVLTETLRRHATAMNGAPRVDVPVIYRDGSAAEPFPFRSLKMGTTLPSNIPCLKVTLLSIRHVEMDTEVHGAWLRNSRISRTREAGLTDRDAFHLSLSQLRRLREYGPVTIEMYQTGLQPAIMGFYRAVLVCLAERPGSISVAPRYFIGNNGFERGTPWTMN